MKTIVSWIVTNKEWLFSGAGIVVIAGVVRWIFKKSRNSSRQTIRAGDGSTNVQAGRDVNTSIKKK